MLGRDAVGTGAAHPECAGCRRRGCGGHQARKARGAAWRGGDHSGTLLRLSPFRAIRSTMFVRFRQTARRLQASLSATRWDGGRVRHEHIAGLGSVPVSPSPADRISFWTKLYQRLDALSNRIDAAQRGAILTAIHARIPMPTLDDQQSVQVERAQMDVQFWDTLAGLSAEQIEEQKGLLATVQRTIAEGEPLAADTAAKAQAAKDRLARAEKGEAVAGIVGQPMITGMTEAQMQHAERLARVGDVLGERVIGLVAKEGLAAAKRAERRGVRQLHKTLFERVEIHSRGNDRTPEDRA